MRILVTGASGLLGINLAMEASKQHEVYGVVNAQPLEGVPFHCITAELLAKDAFAEIFEQVKPDAVIHCAALAKLDECETDPAFAELLNAVLPGEIARVTSGRAKMIHISTDAVFDGKRAGYTEDDEPNPLSVYGKTKLAGEWAVMEANSDAIIARINLFGWSLEGQPQPGGVVLLQYASRQSGQGIHGCDVPPDARQRSGWYPPGHVLSGSLRVVPCGRIRMHQQV